MASLIVNQGLQTIGERASLTTPTFGQIVTMAVDNRATTGSNAFSATMTKLNDATSVTTATAVSFNPTPSRSAQTVTHVGVYATNSANITIGGISLHNSVSTGVNTTSTTLVCGVDAQQLAKTSDFQLTITMRIAYSSV
jgi:hypothetical protein